MSESKDADDPDFFLAHKDDEVWGEAVPVRKRPGRLGAVVSVRFAPEEIERLRQESADGNLSRLIRERALGSGTPPFTEERRPLTTPYLPLDVRDMLSSVRPSRQRPLSTGSASWTVTGQPSQVGLARMTPVVG